MRTWAPVAALLVLAVGAPAATAAPRSADADIERGLTLMSQGKIDEALAAFKAAHAANPDPRSAAQVGLAAQALGRWAEAETHLVAALDATSDPWVRRNRRPLEQALAAVRARLGTLHLDVTPPQAAVVLDGQPLAPAQRQRGARVPAGKVEVEVTAPGHVGQTSVVEVAPGAAAHVVLRLARVPPAPEVSPLPAPRPPTAPETPPPAPESPALGIGLLATGVLAVAAGAVLLSLHGDCVGAGDSCDEVYETLAFGVGLGAAGLAAGGFGAYLLLRDAGAGGGATALAGVSGRF